MAYVVAKELHLRPNEILLEWTCEELAVAFGYYMNEHSIRYYESLDATERAKHKPRPLMPADKYTIKFVDLEDITRIKEKARKQSEDIEKFQIFSR